MADRWGEFKEFIVEFRDESDRAAVILGAAKIDELMYQILRHHLLPIAGPTDELLEGDAPIGTMGARIHMLFRLAILDAEFCRSLQLIRKIRNAYAHNVRGCDLDAGAHSDRVRELLEPFRALPIFEQFKSHFFAGKTGTAIEFRVCLAMIVGRLDKIRESVSQVGTSEVWRMIPTIWTKSDDPDKPSDAVA